MFNEHLKIRDTKIGQGVFTSIDIAANLPIFEVRGKVYKLQELPDINHPAILQIGPNIFMGPSGNYMDKINHACSPYCNCLMHIVGNRAVLYSMYLIKAGSELTFDYSTTATDSKSLWQMNCQCGYNTCRGVISGHQYLDDATKQDMKNRGMLPLYITNPEMFQGQ